jgi:hypothetical protein
MDPTPFQLTTDSLISDVLGHFPETGPILVQHGRMFRAPKGQLYADYSRLTVGEYAALNGADVERLLKALKAAIETGEMSRRITRGQSRPSDPLRRGVAIGYTSGRSDPGTVEVQDVVTAQTSRGLD